MNKIHAIHLGYAGAIVSAVIMLILGILGNLGIYSGAVAMMEEWHLLFSLSITGILGGMIEAAFISFVILYAVAMLYNWLSRKS